MTCIVYPGRARYPARRLGSETIGLARLLCAFVYGLPLRGDWVVRHTCDNKCCINVQHLKYGTVQDNVHDAMCSGLHPSGTRHGRSTLTDEQVEAIRQDERSYRIIAEDYGVSRSTVYRIKNKLAYKDT